MIIDCSTEDEYRETLRLLAVINELRHRGPEYHPPMIDDTPWVQVVKVKECYL